MNLGAALQQVLGGATLSRADSRAVFGTALAHEPDPVQLAGLLAALAQRGETADEILGAAEALRAAAVPFEHEHPGALDTCGTGGDGLGTFNLSTTAALVAAAAGARVIKHGNRSVSSACGSADLLEAAGVALELSPGGARECLDELGICYLHAPAYHPAMRSAMPVRRALGVRTIFNLLGPLANPGRVRRQLLGIADAARLDDYAAVLSGLGHERGYVVHGGGGADELTLAPVNAVRAVGDAPALESRPEALGLDAAPVSALRGGDAGANLASLRRLLDGDGGPLRDALLLNSAAALVVAGVAADALDGVRRAAEALDSGRARALLEKWAALSRALEAA